MLRKASVKQYMRQALEPLSEEGRNAYAAFAILAGSWEKRNEAAESNAMAYARALEREGPIRLVPQRRTERCDCI